MDCTIFTERLRALAGRQVLLNSPSLDSFQVMGRLGFVLAVRRAQALAVALVMVLSGIYVLGLVGGVSQLGMIVVALGYALAMQVVLFRFPYWSPRKPLAEGLLALSECRLNDPDRFFSHILSDLACVNNTMLSELCLQLALDQRSAQND